MSYADLDNRPDPTRNSPRVMKEWQRQHDIKYAWGAKLARIEETRAAMAGGGNPSPSRFNTPAGFAEKQAYNPYAIDEKLEAVRKADEEKRLAQEKVERDARRAKANSPKPESVQRAAFRDYYAAPGHETLRQFGIAIGQCVRDAGFASQGAIDTTVDRLRDPFFVDRWDWPDGRIARSLQPPPKPVPAPKAAPAPTPPAPWHRPEIGSPEYYARRLEKSIHQLNADVNLPTMVGETRTR